MDLIWTVFWFALGVFSASVMLWAVVSVFISWVDSQPRPEPDQDFEYWRQFRSNQPPVDYPVSRNPHKSWEQ